MNDKARDSLRVHMERMIEQAARAGMEDARQLADMTLHEMELELTAFSARRQKMAENMDLLAWLIGRYVMTALHAPRRYPTRPDGIVRKQGEMAPADMKQVFRAIAERRNDDGGC